jgi:hypothetical protein
MTVQSPRSWSSRGAARVAGIAGIVTVVLVLGGQSLIQVGGAEPPFGAPAEDIIRFFETRDARLFEVGTYLAAIGLIVFLWFLGGLWAVLRRAEGEPGWLSAIVLGSGLLFLASVTHGWNLAMFRVEEGIDPQIARLAFDMGNFGFASSWIPVASLLIASGWIILETRVFTRWLGWGAIVVGIGLLASRAAWTSAVVFVPYLLFWLWVIAICVTLLRRRETESVTPA